jgi:endonuclease-8
MPEGDTVHRVARRLDRGLTGRELTRVALHGEDVPELAGRRVERVEAIGKHTLVHLAGGWSVRVHLGMHGRWRRQHVRQALPRRPTLLLEAGASVYLCEGAYRAEPVRSSALRSHPKLARLGPDLLADPPAIDGAVRRARQEAYGDREIGDLLLDQRVASGIGNVYKSEALFECGVDPRAPVRSLGEAELCSIFQRASELMRRGVESRRRTHVPLRRRPRPSSERLWVYGRTGRPCLDCGTRIERYLQGETARSTFWCPSCQSSSASGGVAGT